MDPKFAALVETLAPKLESLCTMTPLHAGNLSRGMPTSGVARSLLCCGSLDSLQRFQNALRQSTRRGRLAAEDVENIDQPLPASRRDPHH